MDYFSKGHLPKKIFIWMLESVNICDLHCYITTKVLLNRPSPINRISDLCISICFEFCTSIMSKQLLLNLSKKKEKKFGNFPVTVFSRDKKTSVNFSICLILNWKCSTIYFMLRTTLFSHLISLNSSAFMRILSPMLKYFFRSTPSGAMMKFLWSNHSTHFTVTKTP